MLDLIQVGRISLNQENVCSGDVWLRSLDTCALLLTGVLLYNVDVWLFSGTIGLVAKEDDQWPSALVANRQNSFDE
jgi:hypothetical protein